MDMAEARSRLAWATAAAVMCVIANANRDVKRRPQPFGPADFDPHEIAAARRRTTTNVSVDILKRVFVCDSSARNQPQADG